MISLQASTSRNNPGISIFCLDAFLPRWWFDKTYTWALTALATGPRPNCQIQWSASVLVPLHASLCIVDLVFQTVSGTTCNQVIDALSLNVFDPRFPFLLVNDISKCRSLVITLVFQSFASMLFCLAGGFYKTYTWALTALAPGPGPNCQIQWSALVLVHLHMSLCIANLFLQIISQTTCNQVIAALSLNVFGPRFPFLLVNDISKRRSLVITLVFQSFASMLCCLAGSLIKRIHEPWPPSLRGPNSQTQCAALVIVPSHLSLCTVAFNNVVISRK